MSAATLVPPIERRRMTLLSRVPLRGNQRAESADRGRTSDVRLTPRQRQVLDGLIRGLTNKEIAAVLGISEKTASIHVSHILAKLDCATRTQAAAIALAEGLADLTRHGYPVSGGNEQAAASRK